MSGAQAAAPVIQVDWWDHISWRGWKNNGSSEIVAFSLKQVRHHVVYLSAKLFFFGFRLSLQKNIGILKSTFRLVLYIPGGDRWIPSTAIRQTSILGRTLPPVQRMPWWAVLRCLGVFFWGGWHRGTAQLAVPNSQFGVSSIEVCTKVHLQAHIDFFISCCNNQCSKDLFFSS